MLSRPPKPLIVPREQVQLQRARFAEPRLNQLGNLPPYSRLTGTFSLTSDPCGSLSIASKGLNGGQDIRTIMAGWLAMRLLVIEDNAVLSELLAKGLRTAGYETDLLGTAAEARAAVMTTSYAAVILDLGLPDGEGLSILRELRHRKDSTPV